MKTNSSVFKLAKNLGSVGLLFTIHQQGVEALKATAHSTAELDSELSVMADQLQQSMTDEAAMSNSEIKSMLESQMGEMVLNQISQKANLEESLELEKVSLFCGKTYLSL